MNRTTQFRRKLTYLTILVVMLIPLYLLGQPAGGGSDGGGRLAQMRDEFDISESDLGEISPASETMKLASLGMRGVAASLLWKKSHEYRVMHEWDRLKASLNNIALLQPHFDKVWEFQAHNLAYNVSTEFDDYRQRYEMVREGTEFLTKGVKQNRKAPRLIWYTGWFYGSKLGLSDEKKQFRRLFADDEVLHENLREQGIDVEGPEALGPFRKPDNWLIGRLWLNSGYDLVEAGIPIRRQTPINFYETGPKWRIKHAEAIESEGVLNDQAQEAWQRASEDWKGLGERSIPTTASFTIKMGQIGELQRRRAEAIEEIRKIAKPAYERAQESLITTLDPVIQDALRTPVEDRTKSQQSIADNYTGSLVPDLNTVAREAAPNVRLRVLQLVDLVKDLDERITKTDGHRKQINYAYWETLALAEQEERTVNARRLIYEAEQALSKEGELEESIRLYEESFEQWAEIFDDYPILVIDDSAQDLFESIRDYMKATDSDELPEDFPLRTFVELMGEYGDVNPQMYEEVRKTQQEKLAARKAELAEEERKREEELLKEEAAQKAAAEEAEMKDEPAAAVEEVTEVEESAEMEEPAEASESEASEPESNEAEADKADAEQPEADSGEESADESPEMTEEAESGDSEPASEVEEVSSESVEETPAEAGETAETAEPTDGSESVEVVEGS
ncbi:IRE (iron responsive element) [Aporhodopirellula aestuarii]|uniref:IRE (Iron responsive element) n=1 Tax=Aporhodopirellula aestuarii TaxID=2950107 RepID=A0ABT0U9E6_9BACT|nr:IRE (iron responsive element) [Aporhodopirellula aestuarii]MCM2373028.1 IRE (iron responsive element) [Aporhodopirellula aestuarii]